MITLLSGIKTFFRQCLYALTFFACMLILAEWLVPGAVSPFLDPVPIVIIALALLGALALRKKGARHELDRSSNLW